MPLTFTQSDKLFRESRINELARVPEGSRFLKLRSLSRREYLERLFDEVRGERPAVGPRQLFQAAFDDQGISMHEVEEVIRRIHGEARAVRAANEPGLLNQLYRVQEFSWGGLYQNRLEQTIVDNYVKRIQDYDALCRSVDNELLVSMRAYVVSSWYNHWTSIIIEDIFKDHPSVLPAVGLVKQIDFFIHDVPFDLKVTYLPEGFLIDKRRQAGLRPETTLLRGVARRNGIPLDSGLAASALLQDLWNKVGDHPAEESRQLITELRGFRNDLVGSIENDPEELVRWLYENQGERRFDSSNRLFLVLVDQRNYFDSWKLKRARPLMEAKVREHLSNYGQQPGRHVEFQWKGEQYTAISDVIIVKQPQ